MARGLEHIKCPKDIKEFEQHELSGLCKEIRKMIVDVMSTNSGHLGASLGAVELAVAVHYIFDVRKDSLVWDVGHQAYAHKILTGRKEQFNTIRKFKGLSGFPSRSESVYDDFGTGHSSTSISAVLGMAIGKKLKGDESTNIAIIGDGSLTGGMSFEALNHLATENVNVLVIINDNNMSIDPNVGGLQQHLNNIDIRQNYFTDLGLKYHGVHNGNDIDEVVNVLSDNDLRKGVHIVHFKTKKGFGYKYSQDGNPTHWHAPGKFEVESGVGSDGKTDYPKKYQEIVGETLYALMSEDKDVVVVTPAMATGSSLKAIEKDFPDRFFDVGIAEQHAVTFSAGLATLGKKPVCVIYSTFLQRGYDQLIHDVALQNLPVTFLVDRAGLVGRDGATHHGMFDLAYLNAIPNMTLYAPQDENQLAALIHQTGNLSVGPVAIRFPRGKGVLEQPVDTKYQHKDVLLKNSSSTSNLVITIGAIGNQVSSNERYDVLALIKVKPIDFAKLRSLLVDYDRVAIIEDGVSMGGIGQMILAEMKRLDVSAEVELIAFPDEFIGHGRQEELYQQIGMDQTSLQQRLQDIFNGY
ncbi:1-deoxy-D-xylulose-5-phosphate synthase [Parvicella tangerina]|uniref:1-deoxy-D-xylulose-5-phosphate synthase n=1 Tax=Parvicella tangerina TaxID=2829795 RepID=A0A916JKY9_9FLAO|nr:1-deoxy-D-xylulose-5-phosphate synthase [Parvicella tangerina]CAG5077962.1 1-deoxy-D-xylulose-5-phosphate synthase [Parvicella tangerina]